MIIFVIRNRLSNESFVGSTRNNLEYQWSKILHAVSQNLDYPLYNSIRKYGKDAFEIEEWDHADDRKERIILEKEAIKIFNAKSLRGYKTSNFNVKAAKQKETYISKSESNNSGDLHTSQTNVVKKRPVEAIDISDDHDEEITSYIDDEQLLEEDLIYIDKQLHSESGINNAKSETRKICPVEDINIYNENTVVTPTNDIDKKQSHISSVNADDNIADANKVVIAPNDNHKKTNETTNISYKQINQQTLSDIISDNDKPINKNILLTNTIDDPIKDVTNSFIEKVKLALARHKSADNNIKLQEEERRMQIKEKLKIFD